MTTNTRQAGKFFDGFADTFDTFYDGKRSPVMQWIDQRWRSDMFVRYAKTFEVLGDLTGQVGIDIGCGSGPYVAEAIRRGAARVVALDPAPRMLELTRARVERLGKGAQVEYLTGYFPQDAPAGPFDFAIVMGVMDYVPDPPAFLRALRRVVRGKAAISLPSKHWFRTPFRKVRYRLRNCPVWFYDEVQIRKLVAEAGFSRLELYKIPGAGMDFHACVQP